LDLRKAKDQVTTGPGTVAGVVRNDMPKQTPQIIAFHFAGQPAQFAGGPFTAADDDTPRRRFVKDVIAVGEYVHPVHGWRLNVDTSRIDKWVAAYRQMSANGVDVEIVVDHRLDAEAVRGYVVDMYRDGERMFAVHEMIGEPAIALAQTVKNVSVLIDRDFADGTGRKYGEAITHSSIVQQPVVPNQSAFRPIAASRAGLPAPLFLTNSADQTKGNTMDLAQIAELLGAAEGDITDDNAVDKIKEFASGLTGKIGERDTTIADLRGRIEELEKAGEGEKKKAASKIDPDALDMLAEGTEAKLDGLVDAGKINKACRDKLAASLIGTADKRNAYSLSRRVSGTETSIAAQIIGALADNEVPPMGEKTGRQSMSRQTPGDDDKPDKADLDARGKRAMSAAGVKSG